MIECREVSTLEAWAELWDAQEGAEAGRLLIFKKSPICPVSHMAERSFREWLKSSAPIGDLSVVEVDVVNSRPISQRIAADTGVRHESPQALLIGPERRVLWSDSHSGVNLESLGAAV